MKKKTKSKKNYMAICLFNCACDDPYFYATIPKA